MAYEKLIDGMTHSFSRMSVYDSCPYEYYLEYLENDPDRPKQDNFYAENGSACHTVFEELLNKKISLNDAGEKYSELFSEIEEQTRESIMDSTFEKCMDYIVSLQPLPEKYEILGVEKRLKFKIDHYKFVGFADLILRDKETGEVILVDHKSSKHFFKKDGVTPLKNTEEEFLSYKKQMYLYAKGIKDCMGLQVDKIVWHHFKDGGALSVIPFKQEELDGTIDWVIETIAKIKADDEFPPKLSHFRCQELCPYRSTCEYLEAEDEEE